MPSARPRKSRDSRSEAVARTVVPPNLERDVSHPEEEPDPRHELRHGFDLGRKSRCDRNGQVRKRNVQIRAEVRRDLGQELQGCRNARWDEIDAELDRAKQFGAQLEVAVEVEHELE